MTSPSQALNHVYSVFALRSAILIMFLLPLHLRAHRTGTCLFIFWFSLTMLNSITVNRAPGWCDMSSYVIIASRCGIQLAPMCIARRIHRILAVKARKQTQDEIRHDMIVDLFIGICIPLLFLPLFYVVQSNRFVLVESIGCYPAIVKTPLAFPLVVMWPPTFALISAVYFASAVHNLIRRKSRRRKLIERNEDFKSENHWCLMALAGAQVVLILPSGIFIAFFSLVIDASGDPIVPFNWDYIHSDFSQVTQFPTSTWTNKLGVALPFHWERWATIIYALLFFVFFGLKPEASKYYCCIFLVILKPFGYRPSTPDSDVLETSNISASRNHVRHKPWPSLGSLRFMSSDEQDHNCTNNSGERQEVQEIDPSKSSFKSPYHKDDNVVSLGLIAEPKPLFEASSVPRSHSLDLGPIRIKGVRDSFHSY